MMICPNNILCGLAGTKSFFIFDCSYDLNSTNPVANVNFQWFFSPICSSQLAISVHGSSFNKISRK